MLSKDIEREKRTPVKKRETSVALRQLEARENIPGALALLLGSATRNALRVRAMRHLTHCGPDQFAILLQTLSEYSEITAPAWPEWPQQYTHCGQLLLHISSRTKTSLCTFLEHPSLHNGAGPVLWIGVIEAIGLLTPGEQRQEHEHLLATALATVWDGVHYAAAMTLANLAGYAPLQSITVEGLRLCQEDTQALPVLLASSYALLRNGEACGLEVLLRLLRRDIADEGRKAAAFVLATEQPLHLSQQQRERLTSHLLIALHDPNEEVAQYAAHALRTPGTPETLQRLCLLLQPQKPPHVLVAALIAIEEMMGRPIMRKCMQSELVAHITPLLASETAEVRQRACSTLATIGGTYATTVLGAITGDANHPAHLEAIEGLRLLHGILRASVREKVVGWLLSRLHPSEERVQITVLDSLAYIAWQAQVHAPKQVRLAYSAHIEQEGTLEHLLSSPDAWVRQRAIELVGLLECQQPALHLRLLRCLHSDEDSGVRACAAYILSQIVHWQPPDARHSPLPHLILALNDADEHVAETALNSLAQVAPASHPLVVAALREISTCGHASPGKDGLVQAAQTLLKKWG